MIVNRPWGQYTELFQDDAVKVKELIIEPGEGISYQRHFKRSEIWFVSKGSVKVRHSTGDPDECITYTLKEDDVFTVRQGEWHQAYNTHDVACHIIEIQYGEETSEQDIERIEFYSERTY